MQKFVTIFLVIRELHESDRQIIIDYAYQKERENMFIIGSFGHPSPFTEPFRDNRYFGDEEHGTLKGVSVCFGTFGSFVVHAEGQDALHALVDRVAEEGIPFTSIPAFRRYAEPMVERLRAKYGREPKKISEETVFLLEKHSFRPVESQAVMAMEGDRDACVRLEQENPAAPSTAEDRMRMVPEYTFVIHRDDTVVAKAHVHGFSLHYAQIGGVGTLPAYRRRGYGRQCVSALCAHCFGKGVEGVILFTANTNMPAQNLYRSLGFKPIDDFLIAEY